MAGRRRSGKVEVGGHLSSLPLPILTERMVIRLPTPSDAEEEFVAANDRRLLRWFSKGSPPNSSEEQAERIKKIRKAAQTGEALTLNLFDRTSGEPLGAVSLADFNWEDGYASLGYLVQPCHWGEGLATEAAAAVCAEAFRHLDLHRIEAQVWPSNRASVRVLTKLGFVKEGTRRQSDRKGKTWLDCDFYGLLRGEMRSAELRAPGAGDNTSRSARSPESPPLPKSLRRFQGVRGFPPPYQIMFRQYPTPEGTVEQVLLERWLYLCPATYRFLYEGSHPRRPAYRRRSRPELERFVRDTVKGATAEETVLHRICSALARMAEKKSDPWPEMVFGGTEEEILARGTNLCGDLSRVACIAFQIAGFPSRLVFLADPSRAYYGHTIVEVWRKGAWGAVDCLCGVVYHHPAGSPVSVWDLQQHPEWIDLNRHKGYMEYVRPDQFQAAAIVDYPIEDHGRFSYGTGSVNPYYARILEMSDRGWPGGPRWLHGEDRKKRPLPPKTFRT